MVKKYILCLNLWVMGGLLGMQGSNDPVLFSRVYEYTISSGTHIYLDFNHNSKKIIIESIPVESKKPVLLSEGILKNETYQKINKTLCSSLYSFASKVMTVKNPYQATLELIAVYDVHAYHLSQSYPKKEEFSVIFSENQESVTITPVSLIPTYYKFVIPSDSPLTVITQKDIELSTALGHIFYEARDSNHPFYEKGEIIVNNIPYAYYPIPKITLITKAGSIFIKKLKKKLNNRSGAQDK